jgi:hypothetical protein
MTETNLIEDLRLLSPPSHAWLLWLLAVLAGVGLLIVWATRRRHTALRVVAPDLSLAAWEAALRDLERLAPWLVSERSRDYGIASTQVLRGFVEWRFGVRAPRLATEEFLAEASRHDALPVAQRGGLERYLRLCDLLKFARTRAECAELRELHQAAVEFVMASKPPVVPT